MFQIRVVSLVGREDSFLNCSIKFDASFMKRADYIFFCRNGHVISKSFTNSM
jgi:hypothetical protein